MKRSLSLIGLLNLPLWMLAWNRPIHADDQTVLNLGEAQTRLFEHNRDLASAALDRARAESQWRESRAALSPSLDIAAQYSLLSEKNHIEFEVPVIPGGLKLERDLGSHERWETGLDLSYPLFTGFAKTRQIEARRWTVEAQNSRVSALRNHASLRLAALHFAWRAARATLTYQDAQCALSDAQWKSAETQQKLGVQSDRVVLAARSRWLATENERLIAGQQVDSLQWEATQILGMGETWLWSAAPLQLALPESLGHADVTPAFEARPELQSLKGQKSALAASEKALEGQHWPSLMAMAGLRYANPGLNLAGTEPMGYALAGMQLKWNLWDGGRQGQQRRELRLRQDQIEVESAKWKDEWRKGASLAARQFLRWRSQAAAAQAARLAAERSLLDARRSLGQGLVTPLDTLDTFAQTARARMLEEQAQAMQALAYCQWLYARGDTLNFQTSFR